MSTIGLHFIDLHRDEDFGTQHHTSTWVDDDLHV